MDRSELPHLREVIAAFDLKATKSLGQNFLLDQNITDKIVRLSEPLKDITVIEIGPGPGGLTRSLLASEAKKVIAIEYDPRAIKALEHLKFYAGDRLEIIHEDALKINLCDLAKPPVKIIANLPYNISTVLIAEWLRYITHFGGITVMLQKEVAERLKAKPGTKDYGRLSVMVQWLCEVKILFDVPRQAFVPPPKVTSSVVSLTPRKEPLAPADFDKLQRLLKVAFNQRRKMLRSSLKELFANPEEVLEGSGIKPTQRPEELEVHDFCRLSAKMA